MRATATAFACFLLLLGSPSFSQSDASPEAPSITPVELQERRDAGAAPVVIDVRTAEEYAAGHIPGAVNMPFDQVAERISEVEAPHGVALYCMVGPRARKGEAALLATGHESVLHLEGGMAAWQAAGLPIVEKP
jgi:rhodanese-related sulfurtransferase